MNFKYRARASSGDIHEGIVQAEDQSGALHQLRGTGYLVISLTPIGDAKTKKTKSKSKDTSQESPELSFTSLSKSSSSGKKSFKSLLSMDLGALLSGGRVPLKNLMVFFRQLATMENAGLSLATSLDVIADGEKNYSLRKALNDIKSRLDRGIPLSEAMKSQKAFNPLLIALVQSGEEGGLLGPALDQGAILLEKQQQLRSKIRSAMFYPSFIMIFAVAILIFFFLFLVPKFEETFSALNIELPQITLTMFGIGKWFSENWPYVAGGVVAIILLFSFLARYKTTKKVMDKIKLKLPVIKDLSLKASMARSSRTLSALTSAGVPIVRGVEMAEGTADNEVVKDGYEELRKSITRGISLGDAAKNAKIFPVLVSQMMRIGEETGHLDSMLERVAAWYDQELDEQIKATVSLMEPVMIVFVGIIIAIIATSIFAPVTSAIVQLS
ncbi:MAG: type II secretion system F family protein [Synergistaceae bacterium]|nr:type II secretion system F family protein [Synergistaceae bacterium]MBQ6435736.1 type II secretion system F family protein [Synergistaceae bacterium]MBR0075673.1 type II secretion system F family protein [Synergistaceae bacterium]